MVYLWFECRNTLMHPFVHHHRSCLTAQKPDTLVFYLIVAPVSWQMYTVFFSSPQQPVNHQWSGISFIFSSPVCRTGKHVVKIISKLSWLTEKCSEQEREMSSAGAYEAESVKTSCLLRCLLTCKRFSLSINSMFLHIFIVFGKNTDSNISETPGR